MPPRASLDAFREVWTAEAGISAPPGERLDPVCLAARELRSGRSVRLGPGAIQESGPPYSTAPDSVFVAFDAPRALGFALAAGWPSPSRVLDLRAEFRCRTSGLDTPHGAGLYAALAWHGLDSLPGAERPRLDALAARGGPWGAAEVRSMHDGLESRVVALEGLLSAILPELDLGHALLRGRYMVAVARMEREGVPIDVPTLRRLRLGWGRTRPALIRDIDAQFGVFDEMGFRANRWADYVEGAGLPWPRLGSGSLDMGEDAFREMARSSADVALVRELKNSLARPAWEGLSVGADGRCRTPLRPFASKTGRNQPSSSGFVFGPSCWLRGLIKPGPGRAVAYVDWCQQEFGIAAALSGDPAMRAAYESGDPYLAFGRQAGAIPPGATRETNGATRERFKACALAVQYGMGAESLANRIGQSAASGRELLALHRSTYPTYWRWSDAIEADAFARGSVQSVFGWTLRVGADANPRTFRNFPCQANGAEMLRLACSLATERGIQIAAPIHDAVLIEAPARAIGEAVAGMEAAMVEASEVVLDGFRLRTEVKVVRWPDRYMDGRGREFWDRLMRLLPPLPGRESLIA